MQDPMSCWRGVLLPVDEGIRIIIRELQRMMWNSLLLVGTPVPSLRIVRLSRRYWAEHLP